MMTLIRAIVIFLSVLFTSVNSEQVYPFDHQAEEVKTTTVKDNVNKTDTVFIVSYKSIVTGFVTPVIINTQVNITMSTVFSEPSKSKIDIIENWKTTEASNSDNFKPVFKIKKLTREDRYKILGKPKQKKRARTEADIKADIELNKSMASNPMASLNPDSMAMISPIYDSMRFANKPPTKGT